MKKNINAYSIRKKGTDTWVNITKEEFQTLTLETSNRMPEIQGNKVIVTSYFNTFWGRIMGARNFRVFLTLSQFAYGNKDYSYPSLQTLCDICNMSKNTVKGAVKELEELGFLIQVQTFNEQGENENNIYIIRKTTPFLSVEQYESLPPSLQKRHRDYIENIEKSERIALTNLPNYPKPTTGMSKIDTPAPVDNVDKPAEKGVSKTDLPQSDAHVGQILTDGESIPDTRVGQEVTPNQYNVLSTTKLKQLNHTISSFAQAFKEKIKSKINPSAYQAWIESLNIRGFDEHRGIMSVQAEYPMQKEWVESRYMSLFKSVLSETFQLFDMDISVTLAPNRI